MKWIAALSITFILWFAPLANAVSVNISNIPSSITDQPFNIDVSVASASAGTNYLRANLFPTGTTNYFGYTMDSSTFYNGSDYSQYFPITIDPSGKWSGTIQAKLDSSSHYFTGAGTYSLKVRRYTQSGSSYTWSNEVLLTVDFGLPSPSPSPSPTPTPTSSSKPKSATLSSAPTKSASPNPSTSMAPTAATTVNQGAKPLAQLPNLSSVSGVASQSSDEAIGKTEVAADTSVNWKRILGIVVLVFGLGAGLFIWKSL